MSIIDAVYLGSVLTMCMVVLCLHKHFIILIDKKFQNSNVDITTGVRTFVEMFTLLSVILIPVLNTYLIITIIINMLKLFFKK